MTKTEMTTLLRSVGVNENTITAMENAFEIGVEQGRSEFVEVEGRFYSDSGFHTYYERQRGEE
jgi:hypothetical protein